MRALFILLIVEIGLGAIHAVKQDGSGDFLTIQACANAAQAGDTCLVSGGVYDEHVLTARGGTDAASRITFKTQGVVTMKGFDISHPYVTVDGFDVTGDITAFYGYITVFSGGSGCHILNNVVRDGIANKVGIYFYLVAEAANNCVVRGNRLSNLSYVFLSTNGDGHLFYDNVMEYQNSRDYIRLFGSNLTFRRNIFWRGTVVEGQGHPDVAQNFGSSITKSENHLFEENWIADLPSQLCQLNSGDGLVANGILYANIKNLIFRRNVISNTVYNGNIQMPGVKFENNTLYRFATELSGISYLGSLSRGDVFGGSLKNNVFLAGGAQALTVNGTSGYYTLSGAVYTVEVIGIFVTGEGVTGPIATGIFNDLVANGYIDTNGIHLANAKALTDISEFILHEDYSAYRDDVYAYLISSVQMEANALATFSADYNFVAGDTPGFPTRKSDACDPGSNYTRFNFCETNGINGGDPELADIALPLGPDGIPFTLDDGLKPLPGSPLCGAAEGGGDIGAYSCDPAKVFSADSVSFRVGGAYRIGGGAMVR